jgi:SAM-dependent methyltransferase
MLTGGKKSQNYHSDNPDYWDILLVDIKDADKWEGKVALDYGCGNGRNLINLKSLANWSKLHGCDIAPDLIKAVEEQHFIQAEDTDVFVCDGESARPLGDETVDFAMSTLVLEHISSYSVRFDILSDLFRVLKEGGVLSIQMTHRGQAAYFTEAQDPGQNCSCSDKDITYDLEKIGFSSITHTERPAFKRDGHTWIYTRAEKI